jgi:hypothetical protein
MISVLVILFWVKKLRNHGFLRKVFKAKKRAVFTPMSDLGHFRPQFHGNWKNN